VQNKLQFGDTAVAARKCNNKELASPRRSKPSWWSSVSFPTTASMSFADIADYLASNVQDPVSRPRRASVTFYCSARPIRDAHLARPGQAE